MAEDPHAPIADAPGGENQQPQGPGQATDPAAKVKEEAKEKVWVERDKCVSAAVRNATAQLQAFATKSKAQLSRQLQAEKEILADADESFHRSFAGEIKMLRVRLEAWAVSFSCRVAFAKELFLPSLRCSVFHRSKFFYKIAITVWIPMRY